MFLILSEVWAELDNAADTALTYFCELMPSMVRIIRSLSSSSNLLLWDLDLSRLIWKWYWPIGTSWKKNRTMSKSYLNLCVRIWERATLTLVLILPLSVVMLSRWWRLAKGLAAPQDSRYRVILTDALIFPLSREGRERTPSSGLCLSVWEKHREQRKTDLRMSGR